MFIYAEVTAHNDETCNHWEDVSVFVLPKPGTAFASISDAAAAAVGVLVAVEPRVREGRYRTITLARTDKGLDEALDRFGHVGEIRVFMVDPDRAADENTVDEVEVDEEHLTVTAHLPDSDESVVIPLV